MHLVANVCACVIVKFVITKLQCCCEHVHGIVCGLDYNKILLMSNSKSLVNTIMI